MRHYWSHGEKPRRGAHDFLWALWRWSALGFVQPDGRGAPRDALAAIRPAAKRVIRGCRRLVPGGRPSAARLGFGYGTAPLANAWFERGMPVHRHYLEQFLASSAADIRGRCLEFQEDSYSTRFGGSRVSRVDILHKEPDPRYPQATLHADLTAANDIPGGAFDCIVCTYVLHVIPDLDRFVAELHRLLADGGVLLVAVPGITITYPQYGELWRFTCEGLHRVLARSFGAAHVETRPYGNSLTAAGELRGLAVDDFTRGEIDEHDARYPLLVCARAVKAGREGAR
ncbi:methyltransferase [Sulfurifustis variabilis]|uniref:Methyltransferase n=1 Tax=Sulfurifustis variabilis TaxID=1675686 RepID=A0A1B4V3Y5_9GAMM|nr:methyltransferase domain-containing protein [Sulfurifustis variabilis]BAU48085.1 methyltransferase [Sulfurifustis variabilis]